MVNCHCHDCQRAGGAPFAPLVMVNADDFTSRGETLAFHEVSAASGNLVWRHFCARCGSPLYARTSGSNDRIAVRAVALTDSGWFVASQDVWVESALPWDVLAPRPDAVPTLKPLT